MIFETYQSVSTGFRVFDMPLNLDEMLKRLSNGWKMINEMSVLSGWPAKAAAGC